VPSNIRILYVFQSKQFNRANFPQSLHFFQSAENSFKLESRRRKPEERIFIEANRRLQRYARLIYRVYPIQAADAAAAFAEHCRRAAAAGHYQIHKFVFQNFQTLSELYE